jgi:hypothetical protein
MSAGDFLMTAVCGGGGNDTLGFLVIVVVGALYALAVLKAMSLAEFGDELAILVALFTISVAVGGLVFLYPHGIDGNGDYLGRFVISLVAAGVLGGITTAKLGEQSAGRAFFLALAGDILIPAGIFLLLIASVGIGTGCLD